MQMLDLIDEFSLVEMQAMVWAWNCVATQSRPIRKGLPASIVTIEISTLPFCDAGMVFLASLDHYDWTKDVLFEDDNDFIRRDDLERCIEIFRDNGFRE